MSVVFKKAIVVGGSSGIGEAMAKQLAAEGATVAVVARRASELERVCAGSDKLKAYPHDVENFDEVPALYEKIVGDLGGLDLLVYAAGVMPTVAEGEYSFDKDRQMMAVNVVSVGFCIRRWSSGRATRGWSAPPTRRAPSAPGQTRSRPTPCARARGSGVRPPRRE